MIFPKVLILTLFIFGTFAKGTIEDMEERFEVLERKLAAYEKKDIETNRGWISDINSLVSFTAYFDI